MQRLLLLTPAFACEGTIDSPEPDVGPDFDGARSSRWICGSEALKSLLVISDEAIRAGKPVSGIFN